MHGPSNPNPELKEDELSIYAIEALARLRETIGAVEAAYRDYQFNAVAQQLYNFVWGDFCDWFVEAGKTDIFGEDKARRQSTLAAMDYILSAVIRLLHPFMPHLTEELWSLMGFAEGENEFLDCAPLPQAMALDESNQAKARIRVGVIYETVEAGRNLRAEARIASNQKAKFALRSNESWASEEDATIGRLLNAESLEIDANFQPPARSSVTAKRLGELFVIAGEKDCDEERRRMLWDIEMFEGALNEPDLM